MSPSPEVRTAFIEAALWHGPLDEARALLAAHPDLAAGDLHTAAILGDAESVRRCVAADPAAVRATSPPYGGDALTYLCLSKFLRLEPARSEAFVRTATVLLDAGADPNTGFWTTGRFPERETALYGAAGVAHHEALTRLLLDRGADPNDEEAAYHAPESHDLGALRALVETGRVTPANLVLMLVRKHDWHDEAGVRYLLAQGADPNGHRERGWLPLHHALARDNALAIIRLLLEHGADPTRTSDGRSAIAQAAHQGRSDVLELFAERGVTVDLPGLDGVVAACAMADTAAVRAWLAREPARRGELAAIGGRLLATFAGTGNVPGLTTLLDAGLPVDAVWEEGDGYWDLAPRTRALHAASWRLSHAAVRLLLARGADPAAPDGRGRTPLQLAVRGCVDSYWTEYRAPDAVAALLAAGARPDGIRIPCGYDAVDALLVAAGAGRREAHDTSA